MHSAMPALLGTASLGLGGGCACWKVGRRDVIEASRPYTPPSPPSAAPVLHTYPHRSLRRWQRVQHSDCGGWVR